MTTILDLPDEILLLLFKRYLNITDLLQISNSCKKFKYLIEEFSLWSKFLNMYPLIDFNYPYGRLFLIRVIK